MGNITLTSIDFYAPKTLGMLKKYFKVQVNNLLDDILSLGLAWIKKTEIIKINYFFFIII